MARRIASLAVVCSVVLAGLASANETGTSKSAYDLVIEGDRVSLRVADGRLVDIIEDLGRRLGFEVVATSGVGERRISDEFKELPSREAIRRICASVGYLEVPDASTGRIVRLVLTGGGGGANVLAPRRDPLPARPDPPPVAQPRPVKPPRPDGEQKQEREREKED